jgi:hypothetical protein
MRSHSRIDASWDEGEVIGGKFVVACRDPPTLLLVEEPQHAMPSSTLVASEADSFMLTLSFPLFCPLRLIDLLHSDCDPPDLSQPRISTMSNMKVR